MIRIDNGYLLFDVNGWDYEVPLRDLKTVEGLSQWLNHLNEKNLFNKQLERKIILICQDTFGYVYILD